jgi:Tfp pilus assembly protein PilN
MIKINLLPKQFVPKQRNIIPYVALAGLAVILFVWYGSSLATSLVQLRTGKLELEMLHKELADLDEAVKQVQQLEKEKQLASLKEKAVEQIVAGRTKWSHELYVLSGLVPDRIWLENISISVRRRPVTVETPNPNHAPGQPPTIKKTVLQAFPALRISGYALSPRREEGVELVGRLISNIQHDDVFSKRFIAPEMRSIERQDFKEHTVMKFVMDCEISQ